LLTPRQQEALDAVDAHGGNVSAAGRSLNVTKRGFERLVKRARAAITKNTVPVPGPGGITIHELWDGQKLKGYSGCFHHEKGEIMRWVKTNEDLDRTLEILSQQIESWVSDLQHKIAPIQAPKVCYDDLMTCYPMGDPHFGLYCWAKEVGNDFNLDIAEAELFAAVDYLVHQSPPSHRAVLVNLGDFFHYDSMENLTPASGHVLDSDTRPQRMIDIGIRALRRCLQRMLEKHEIVEMINAPGNHDPILSRAMNVFFRNIYENEPRIKIYDEPTTRHYIEHGKCLIGVTHGDKTKDPSLPGIMATEMPEAWGRTKFRHFWRGHHHHDSVLELNGCKVEQFRTLAPGDAYAVGHGYLSGRDMKAVVFHREYGEQARFTCGIDVLKTA